MPTSIRTLSQLPQISSDTLNDKALFEVSVPVSVQLSVGNVLYKYASRAIQKDQLTNRLIKDVKFNLSTENGFVDSFNFSDLCATVSSIGYGNFRFDGNKDFTSNPTIDNTPLSSYASDNDELNPYSVNYETLKKFTNINSSPAIGPRFGFVTTLSGKRTDTDETKRTVQLFITDNNNVPTNLPSFVFDQNVKNVAQNEFIFKIPYGEHESKEWIAPVTGIFTCYGWLDEINTPSQSNESRWVALMGFEEIVNKWTILQVQPFIKNNYLSYVGFTFPVKRGMHLKIMTGFAVGSNSDKYFASNSSIANHQANAFLGGIYTGLSDVLSNGNLNFTNITATYVTSSDLSGYVTRAEEDACDLSTKTLIDELSGKISNGSVETLSSYVKYIDSHSSNKVFINLRLYNRMCNIETNEDSYYSQTCLDGSGKQSSNSPIIIVRDIYTLFTNGVRSYYAPPTRSGTSPTGNLGYVEKAYEYLPLSSLYGRVFTEGKYLYYCVSQNCNVLITLQGGYTRRHFSAVAAYMLCPDATGKNITAILLGHDHELRENKSDKAEAISIPVKQGTILMFYTWQGLNAFKMTSITNGFNDDVHSMLRYVYLQLNAPCNMPYEINGAVNYSDLIANSSTYVDLNLHKNNPHRYTSYAVWTANQTQRNYLVGNNETAGQWGYLFGSDSAHSGDVYGTVASVVELP